MKQNHQHQVELSPTCAAILSELRSGPKTTAQLMRAVNVIQVSTRVHELRAVGYLIHTRLIDLDRARRRRRRPGEFARHMAEYSLLRQRRQPVSQRAKRRA